MSDLKTYSLKANNASISSPEAKLIQGWQMKLVKVRIHFNVLLLLIRKTRSLNEIIKVFKTLRKAQKENTGNISLRKYVRQGAKYSWGIYTPFFPSPEFTRLLNNEIDSALSGRDSIKPLQFIVLAVTNKCPLNCEHCFEWDRIQNPDQLSLDELKTITTNFYKQGISSVFLTGGEPLSRYHDLLKLVGHTSSFCQTWIFTSGYSLSQRRAEELRNAGLIGVVISIDHYEEDKHNAFRGNVKSYKRAVRAVKNARIAGLIPALSICTTKAFISENNLFNYMHFARSLGAMFVQFMEPEARGRYINADVTLSNQEKEVLGKFFRDFNEAPENADYPTIIYHGYNERNIGCHGTKRYVYIDSAGNIQACPFCIKKIGNAASFPIQFEKRECNKVAASTI